MILQVGIKYSTGWPQKVSHYQKLSLNRIKTINAATFRVTCRQLIRHSLMALADQPSSAEQAYLCAQNSTDTTDNKM